MTERTESLAVARGIVVALAFMAVVVGVAFAVAPGLDGRHAVAPLLIAGGGAVLVLVRRAL